MLYVLCAWADKGNYEALAGGKERLSFQNGEGCQNRKIGGCWRVNMPMDHVKNP